MLTQIIERPLVVKRMLPTEHRLISDKGSLLFLDIIVEFENGELADVEIQKVGFYFPGQRASCYAADMVMRQYERQRSLRGDDFTYQDMKKVYTIVIVEKHSKEMKEIENEYLHRGEWKFDTGLKLDLLEEYFFISLENFFISLENFFKIEDNKEDTKRLSELEAWMYFIGSDNPEHIQKVIENFPWFAELYEDVAYFRHHPEEAIGMFSEALRKLDENTINFMIDDMKGEIDGLKKELADRDRKLANRDKKLADRDKELADKDRKLLEQEQEILELKKLLAEKKSNEKSM